MKGGLSDKEVSKGSWKELGGKVSAAGWTGKTRNCVCRADSVKPMDIVRQSNMELYRLGNASEEP